MTYVYDFGEDWVHRLILTNIRHGESAISYPRIAGEGNGRPRIAAASPGSTRSWTSPPIPATPSTTRSASGWTATIRTSSTNSKSRSASAALQSAGTPPRHAPRTTLPGRHRNLEHITRGPGRMDTTLRPRRWLRRRKSFLADGRATAVPRPRELTGTFFSLDGAPLVRKARNARAPATSRNPRPRVVTCHHRSNRAGAGQCIFKPSGQAAKRR